MNKDITLVVLAAGMGSRFGGLKQIEPIGPGGQAILDFSVYDAIEAGLSKVGFVIKHEIEDDFKAIVGRRMEKMPIKVEYAYLRDIQFLLTEQSLGVLHMQFLLAVSWLMSLLQL